MQEEKKRKNPVFMRFSGLGASAVQRSAYTLPNHPRYQLRYTRILNYAPTDDIIIK